MELRERDTKAAQADVREREGDDDLSTVDSEKWQPGFWRQFPWLGAGALIMVILISLASCLVLVFSNNRAQSQWDKRIAPNVILSVLNSVASVCLAVAVAQGLAISWWRKAMKGATITELHNTWSFGSSLSHMIKNLRYFNLAALAALVTKFAIIDGVLFQRATTTYSALGPQGSNNISTFPSKVLPLTGRLNAAGNDTDVLLYAFTWDIQTWVTSAIYPGYTRLYTTYGFGECEGVCALRYSAPGYIASCSDYQTQSVDIVAEGNLRNGDSNSTESELDLSRVGFSLNFATSEKNYTWIGLNTTSYYKDEFDPKNSTMRCPATVYKQQCELRQAIISYPIYLEHTDVATRSKNDKTSAVNVYLGNINETTGAYAGFGDFDYDVGQFPGFNFESWAITSGGGTPYAQSTNGGIYRALQNQYETRSYVSWTNGSDWALTNTGQFASILADNENDPYQNYTCPWTYDDPLSSVMNGLNALTVITADDIYNRVNYTNYSYNWTDAEVDAYYYDSMTNVTALQFKTEVHYSTNYSYMAGALVSTLVCICLALPVYWGFWQLGRKVSLNPIEIATAFQAPVLVAKQAKSGEAEHIVKVTGGTQVMYTTAIDPETGRSYKIVPK